MLFRSSVRWALRVVTGCRPWIWAMPVAMVSRVVACSTWAEEMSASRPDDSGRHRQGHPISSSSSANSSEPEVGSESSSQVQSPTRPMSIMGASWHRPVVFTASRRLGDGESSEIAADDDTRVIEALGVAERPVSTQDALGVGHAGHLDRKSTRLNSSHSQQSRMPSSA